MLPDGNTVGYVGEHNATTLEITPPESMLTDGISLLCLAVETGRDFIKAVVRSAMVPKADKISIPLWRQATGSPKAKLQLEAYDDGGNLLIKSPVAEVGFLSSVSGVQNVSSINDTSITADIAANTSARHSHSNAKTLNKLGETDGVLTYDGKKIGEAQTAVVALGVADFYTDNPTVLSTVFLLNDTDKIPEGAQIVRIEINTASEENPQWIDLSDMIYSDLFAPYYVNLCRVKPCEAYGGDYLLCYLSFLTDTVNSVQEAIRLGNVYGVRVTYTVNA